MALSSCDPCCDPEAMSRLDASYKAASLRILCDIKTAVETLPASFTQLQESYDAMTEALQALIDILNPA